MLDRFPKPIRILVMAVSTFLIASVGVIFIGWLLSPVMPPDILAIFLVIIFITSAIGMPSFIYGRQPFKYRQRQENQPILVGFRTKVSRNAVIWIVLLSMGLILYFVQLFTAKTAVTARDIYISVAVLIAVISASKLFEKKYTPQQKQIVRIIILFSTIYLLIQLFLFLRT